MSESTADAEEILASVGEPERFAVIFDRHYAAIRDYLGRRIDTSRADDLAAETFVVAFRRRTAYDATYASALPWLFGIAVNLLRRHRRQEHRELRAYARAASELSRRPNESDAHAMPADLASQLANAVRSLKHRDRDVLFLYACADLSYAEISRALGIPVGTVRSRLARGRKQVRELLEGERTRPNEGTVYRESA